MTSLQGMSQGFVVLRPILCFLLCLNSQIQKHEFVRELYKILNLTTRPQGALSTATRHSGHQWRSVLNGSLFPRHTSDLYHISLAQRFQYLIPECLLPGSISNRWGVAIAGIHRIHCHAASEHAFIF